MGSSQWYGGCKHDHNRDHLTVAKTEHGRMSFAVSEYTYSITLHTDALFFDEKVFKGIERTITVENLGSEHEIREKQVLRAKKVLQNGKVRTKKILRKPMRALKFQCHLKFRCQTRESIPMHPRKSNSGRSASMRMLWRF